MDHLAVIRELRRILVEHAQDQPRTSHPITRASPPREVPAAWPAVRSWRSFGDPEGKSPRLLDRGTAMNREPDAGGPGHLTPETLAELEELVRLRLGARVREFRLSLRDSGLVPLPPRLPWRRIGRGGRRTCRPGHRAASRDAGPHPGLRPRAVLRRAGCAVGAAAAGRGAPLRAPQRLAVHPGLRSRAGGSRHLSLERRWSCSTR